MTQVKQVEKRRRANLDPQVTQTLTAFVNARSHNPYANQTEKEELAKECGITPEQVSNWLTNWRKRRWRPPKVVELTAADPAAASAAAAERGLAEDFQVQGFLQLGL
jgi:transposase-like protein